MSENKIYITYTSLICATGTHPMSLLGSIMTNNCAPLLHEKIANESLPKPTYLLPVLDLELNYSARIIELFKNTLTSLLPKLNKPSSQKLLFHLLLPAQIDATMIKQLQTIAQEYFINFSNFQFSHNFINQNSSQQLESLCTELQNGNYDMAIFGGLDSLIEINIVNELYQQQCLYTYDECYGFAPGEAAGFIVLQKSPERALARIKKLATKTNIQQTDHKEMIGMQIAIKQLLAEETKNNIDSVLQPLGASINDPLEWYQTTQAIWPNQPLPEELNLFRALGEVGAATLPLNLILATARLKLAIPNAKEILVCDANQHCYRGAILLTSSNSDS